MKQELIDIFQICRKLSLTVNRLVNWITNIFAGYGYNVKYPRRRYTNRRIYADNFKWKGFPSEDPDA